MPNAIVIILCETHVYITSNGIVDLKKNSGTRGRCRRSEKHASPALKSTVVTFASFLYIALFAYVSPFEEIAWTSTPHISASATASATMSAARRRGILTVR
jgi:hypothetical protein